MDQPALLWRAFAPGYDAVTAGFFLPAVGPARRGRTGDSARERRNQLVGLCARCDASRRLVVFVTFYGFAWQATLHRVEWLTPLAELVTIGVAIISLARRLDAHQPPSCSRAGSRAL